MDALIGTFHIDWKLILAQLINFAVVFFVLYKFAIKPLSKLMDERKATISQGLSDAKENATLVAESKKAYDDALAQARKDAAELTSEMKKSVEAKRAEMMDGASKEVAALLEEGKNQLANEKQKMLKDAEREIASLVIAATEKVLDGVATGKVSEELVVKSIEQSK